MTDTGGEPAVPGIDAYCPYYAAAMELLSRRWAGSVLRALITGSMRFRDLATAIPGITDRMLSQRLKDLEAAGLVDRIVHPRTPVQIEYRLTDKGLALGGVLLHLNQWALDWITLPDKPSRDPDRS
ncbi:winged helix-turn-helix transcriptional regulator [Nocardia huaxiensis]|uniref:Helix-turn-helix transcriptional regulator n=1 Tax=Nocardia huaxiensis TaxID=2755382 RepID=A0A7D6VEM2_9NOCA|nr:helix-turn-helix domain-containing protein [Nocardia huaxiensis]QLY34612.1 helix-turn-helix transcriptional regulator [Nocardia huaxiensis]UFS99919.1 helix-turn-helix transcriptional regulator [Nocardia huaxiensis]